jgi:hypothetical protein
VLVHDTPRLLRDLDALFHDRVGVGRRGDGHADLVHGGQRGDHGELGVAQASAVQSS